MFDRRDYFRDRFTAGELRILLDRIQVAPRELVSKRSKAYQSRRAEIESLSDDELLKAMVAEPTLIRRPLVVSGTSSVVGSGRSDLEQFVHWLASRKG